MNPVPCGKVYEVIFYINPIFSVRKTLEYYRNSLCVALWHIESTRKSNKSERRIVSTCGANDGPLNGPLSLCFSISTQMYWRVIQKEKDPTPWPLQYSLLAFEFLELFSHERVVSTCESCSILNQFLKTGEAKYTWMGRKISLPNCDECLCKREKLNFLAN